MKSWPSLILLTAVFSVGVTSHILAAQITFTYSGTATGTIDTTQFSNAGFTITALGDTSHRQSKEEPYPVYWIDHNSVSISIDGVGDFQINSPTRTGVNQVFSGPFFSFAGPDGYDLYDGPVNHAFATWDMLASIGPIMGQTWFFGYPISTSGGDLLFPNQYTTGTFQATVPEPTTIALLAAGAFFMLGCLWSRRR